MNTQVIDPQLPVLIKHADGTVHRRCVCQCNRVLYKKNLTTGEYTLQDGNYLSRLLPGGEQGEYRFQCDCGIGHIVRHIKEGVRIDDDVDNEVLQNQ